MEKQLVEGEFPKHHQITTYKLMESMFFSHIYAFKITTRART